MTLNSQKVARIHPSWFSRFWAVVRYEMLWTIRKKKFIGIVILGFVIASLSLFLPPILSYETGQTLASNPNYVATYNIPAFGLFLFALATAMNSISSEFETGTIVPLLTKPISRTMVFLGKLFAALVIILVTYAVFFAYSTVGGTIIYGAQNNLQLVPLGLLGNVLTTFIWIAVILAVGSLSKNTLMSALVAFGLFLALLIAVPIVSAIAGPSVALNYLPGNGASGVMSIPTGHVTIGGGPDNLATNLVNYALYPSASVNFTKVNIQMISGQEPLITETVVYTEPISVVALRSLSVAFAYTFAFLVIAWYALKRAQILE